MKRALLLNADWAPLHFISDVRAINLLVKGRAEVIDIKDGYPSVWNEWFAYVNGTIQVPATLKLITRINRKWKPPRFRKKVLFNRDAWTCQYCRVKLHWDTVTVDHVLPSSRGGQTSWTNCVTSCKSCNRKKANRTPDEANMRLVKQPTTPTPFHFWDLFRCDSWHDDWGCLLGDTAAS